MRFSTVLLLASLALGAGAYAEDAPGEMSLELYKKIKSHFDTLYGANAALLPGIEPPNKAETEKKLREDVTANKDALIKALTAGKPLHRELSARALEYCSEKGPAIEALGKAINTDTDESVRRACAAALAKLPDAAAVDPLIKALGDTADSVRGIVATALGNIKDNRAVEPLLRMLEVDAKPLNRLQAATALSKIKEPSSLEKLQKLLQTEKDERVKMAIAGAMRTIMGGNNKNTEEVPTAEGAAAELAALSREMKEVEEKLRNDRHDQAVQVQGQGIEQKLAVLIEKLDKMGGQGQGQGREKSETQQQQAGSGQNAGKSSGSPLRDSKLGGAVPPGAINAAMVADKQDAWAKLPPAQRDELLQAFREEMPERWRKRLEAYFLSVAAEQVKDADK